MHLAIQNLLSIPIVLSALGGGGGGALAQDDDNNNNNNNNNRELIDPAHRFDHLDLELPQPQSPPAYYHALQSDFPSSPPDCGEGDSYVGTGRLRGRKALITGGDSGIGRAVAIAFAKEGASEVTINYLPEEEPDAESLDEYFRLSGLNGTTTLRRIPGDLTNETFCGDLVTRAHEEMGGLDILVNNAGYSGLQYPLSALMDITNRTTSDFDRYFKTNLYAGFFTSRAAVPLMRPGSSIIFTASLLAENPDPTLVEYGTSKAAVAYYARALAAHLSSRGYGIRVNAVQPALTYSPFLASAGFSTEDAEESAAMLPQGRLEQPVELAPIFVGFADEMNSFTNGEMGSTAGMV